eukprot:5820215-Pleurochrysis_carterae.AAC.2
MDETSSRAFDARVRGVAERGAREGCLACAHDAGIVAASDRKAVVSDVRVIDADMCDAADGEIWIQDLWEGYGSVSSKVGTSGKPVVVKRVNPPQSICSDAHRRKIRCYEVEAAFYSSMLPSWLCSAGATVALAACAPSPSLMVLDDLRLRFPVQRQKGKLSDAEICAALEWAATLHAETWEGRGNWVAEMAPALWPNGTFYRLDTRREELEETFASSPQLGAVARAVDLRLRGHTTLPESVCVRCDGPAGPGQAMARRGALDVCRVCGRQRARNVGVGGGSHSFEDQGRNDNFDACGACEGCQTFEGMSAHASGWALLHGDLKAPNLFFSDAGSECRAAACDFQYTGPGCVMKDVAYLLCNSVREDQLDNGRDRAFVAHYVEALARARRRLCATSDDSTAGVHASPPVNCRQTSSPGQDMTDYTLERAWGEYELAVCDYARFLQGWAPPRGRTPSAYALRTAEKLKTRLLAACATAACPSAAVTYSLPCTAAKHAVFQINAALHVMPNAAPDASAEGAVDAAAETKVSASLSANLGTSVDGAPLAAARPAQSIACAFCLAGASHTSVGCLSGRADQIRLLETVWREFPITRVALDI